MDGSQKPYELLRTAIGVSSVGLSKRVLAAFQAALEFGHFSGLAEVLVGQAVLPAQTGLLAGQDSKGVRVSP